MVRTGNQGNVGSGDGPYSYPSEQSSDSRPAHGVCQNGSAKVAQPEQSK